MAAPMELFCWPGGWGLPSVDPDCLAVLTYARFTGAPLKVRRVSSPWWSPSGHLPALRTRDGGIISKAQQIIAHLRKQKFNADSQLSAAQGADSLAFVALLEEKLLPVLTHTFWLDAPNYSLVTRRCFARLAPFPLSLVLPGRMQRRHRERLEQLWGRGGLEDREWLEKELYRDARECLSLLSQRLGTQRFFFGDSPTSLDAAVFSCLAPLLKAKLPSGKLQQHLQGLRNLCEHSSAILSLYFPWDGGDPPSPSPAAPPGGDADEEPHKRRCQALWALLALAAMLGYAVLSGIVAVGGAAGGGAAGRRRRRRKSEGGGAVIKSRAVSRAVSRMEPNVMEWSPGWILVWIPG